MKERGSWSVNEHTTAIVTDDAVDATTAAYKNNKNRKKIKVCRKMVCDAGYHNLGYCRSLTRDDTVSILNESRFFN